MVRRVTNNFNSHTRRMKTDKQIEDALERLEACPNTYHNMTYKDGISEALNWILENISDEEFEFGPN